MVQESLKFAQSFMGKLWATEIPQNKGKILWKH